MTTDHGRSLWWHDGAGDDERRGARLDTGATVWLTGLPAAGKSTLAVALEAALLADRRAAYRLDGDNLRHGLNADLGFDAASRDENVRRIAEVARLFADAGIVAIAPVVSPYAAGRAAARRLHVEAGLRFVEVHVATPLHVCEVRDPKGLYARARRGELRGMTGVDDPYEPPVQPDLRVDHRTPLADAVAAILDTLAA